ncbi:MAG: FAD-binding oxidoreductase [Armatimonadota bacterium]
MNRENGLVPTAANVDAALGQAPLRVIQVDSVDSLRAALAQSDGNPIVPWGGGAGQLTGLPCKAPPVIIDLRPFCGIIEHDIEDMTISVKPGTRLIDLQAHLSEHNQFLPVDPSYPVVTTIGGMVAAAASGYLATGYGTVRDLLIGLEAIDTSGNLIHGGGRVVKNVTGYDLPKLMTGSNGQLAILSKLTFRAMPRPEARASVVATGPAAALIGWMIDLRPPMDPVSAVILCRPDETTDYGTLSFHGATEAVAAAAFGAASSNRTGVTAQAYEGEYLPDPIEGNLVIRIQTQPSTTTVVLSDLRETILSVKGTITVLPLSGRLGISWIEPPGDASQLVSNIVECCKRHCASWFIDESPISLRTDHWCGPPATDSVSKLNAGIRSAFDPDGKLNAERFGLGQ